MRNIKLFLVSILCISIGHAELTETEIDGLLNCYKEKLDNTGNFSEKFKIALSQYPEDLYYKLFIDKKRLLNPKETEKNQPPHLIFDVDEPGYFSSMNNAFKNLSQFEGKVDLDLIIELHDLAVLPTMQKGIAGGYHYGFDKKNYMEAFVELFNSNILGPGDILFKIISSQPIYDVSPSLQETQTHLRRRINEALKIIPISHVRIGNYVDILNISRLNLKDFLHNKLEPLIKHYYESIEQSATLDGRLMAIAELLRAFEVGHFFPDGNQRTYAFLLLPKLLIENGIPPAILEDPTMFDGYMTVKDMAAAIRVGVVNFLEETHEKQKNFLLTQCELKQLEEQAWTKNQSDYMPYFETQDYLPNKIRNLFAEEITTAINNKKVNARSSSLGITPLEAAIYLGSKDDIDKLITEGATLFPDKISFLRTDMPRSEIFVAFILGSFDIVSHLLTKDEVKKANPKHVLDIFDEILKIKNYKERLNQPASETIVTIVGQLLALVKNNQKLPDLMNLLNWMEDIVDYAYWPKILQMLKDHPKKIVHQYLVPAFVRDLPDTISKTKLSAELITDIVDNVLALIKNPQILGADDFKNFKKVMDDKNFQKFYDTLVSRHKEKFIF